MPLHIMVLSVCSGFVKANSDRLGLLRLSAGEDLWSRERIRKDEVSRVRNAESQCALICDIVMVSHHKQAHDRNRQKHPHDTVKLSATQYRNYDHQRMHLDPVTDDTRIDHVILQYSEAHQEQNDDERGLERV